MKKSKTNHNIEKSFIILGLLEIFVFIFLSQNLFLMCIGIITIIPAYLACYEGKIKFNYLTGILALLKYNPINIALFSFVLGDIISSKSFIHAIIFWIFLIFIIISFVCAIILMIKTSQYLRKN